MSLDYPDYLKIREQNRWLGAIWQIGDKGYYFGLLVLVIVSPLTIFSVWALEILNGSEKVSFLDTLRSSGASFILGVLVCFFSALLKSFAHRKGGTYSQNGKGS